MIRALLAALALAGALSSHASAIDLQNTAVSGRQPGVGGFGTTLTKGEIAINRADRNLYFAKPDGSVGIGALLNAVSAARTAIESGDFSGVSATPSASAATGTLARLLADRAPLASPTFTGTVTAPAATIAGLPIAPNNYGTGVAGINNTPSFDAWAPSAAITGRTDFVKRFDYRPQYTGGGGSTTNLYIYTEPKTGNTDNIYGILSKMYVSTENGSTTNWVSSFNACQKVTRLTSACWGGVSQTVELSATANPTTNSTAHEFNNVGNGSDSGLNRTTIAISAQRADKSGAMLEVARGILMGPENGDATQARYYSGIEFVGGYDKALNLSRATCAVFCWQSPGATISGNGRAIFADGVAVGTQQGFIYENSSTTGQLGIRAGTSSNAIYANFDPTNGFAVQGPLAATLATVNSATLTPTAAGNLPSCTNGTNSGRRYTVNDAANISYRGAVTGGGTGVAGVLCTGSGWVYGG